MEPSQDEPDFLIVEPHEYPNKPDKCLEIRHLTLETPSTPSLPVCVLSKFETWNLIKFTSQSQMHSFSRKLANFRAYGICQETELSGNCGEAKNCNIVILIIAILFFQEWGKQIICGQ